MFVLWIMFVLYLLYAFLYKYQLAICWILTLYSSCVSLVFLHLYLKLLLISGFMFWGMKFKNHSPFSGSYRIVFLAHLRPSLPVSFHTKGFSYRPYQSFKDIFVFPLYFSLGSSTVFLRDTLQVLLIGLLLDFSVYSYLKENWREVFSGYPK